MKKIKVLSLSIAAALVTSFATSTIATELEMDDFLTQSKIEEIESNEEEYLNSKRPTYLDPDNPDSWGERPEAEMEVFQPTNEEGDISVLAVDEKGMPGATIGTRIDNHSLYWEGTHYTKPVGLFPYVGVIGELGKQLPGASKVTWVDSDGASAYATSKNQIAVTGENKQAKGSVGTLIIGEGTHTITTIFGDNHEYTRKVSKVEDPR